VALLPKMTCDLKHQMGLCHPVPHFPHTSTVEVTFETLEYIAAHCNTPLPEYSLMFFRLRFAIATHCNTLQHTATHCNTLQHTATHCNTLQHTEKHFAHQRCGACRRRTVGSRRRWQGGGGGGSGRRIRRQF